MKSGAGAEDVYTPKLNWFDEADSFLGNVMTGHLLHTICYFIQPCV